MFSMKIGIVYAAETLMRFLSTIFELPEKNLQKHLNYFEPTILGIFKVVINPNE